MLKKYKRKRSLRRKRWPRPRKVRRTRVHVTLDEYRAAVAATDYSAVAQAFADNLGTPSVLYEEVCSGKRK